jgi:hemolysin III
VIAQQPPRPLLRGWLHASAFVVALLAGPLLAAHGRDPGAQVALSVYALALVLLFGVSAAFHRLDWSATGRRRMQRIDHATIFIGIAGTYTAVAALALNGAARAVLLVVVWSGAAAGIALRQLWLDAPTWAVAAPYLVVGWCALAVLPQLWSGLGPDGLVLVVAGGLADTAGAVAYVRHRPDPAPTVFGYHEVFHACTVVGAVLDFLALALYALPRS